MRTNKFILQTEETTPKSVVKKAAYTSTEFMRVNKMTMGEIYSDSEVKGIIVDSGATDKW